jgi:tocopherol O-methyltransferase
MPTYNVKEKIVEHYDQVSPYYYSLWGKHLHHGYWVTGKETKEEAQTALIEHLIQVAQIKPGMKILDVGCGFGASSIYLAQKYEANTVGITISPVQVDMVKAAAQEARVNSRFLLMDAEKMTFTEQFDVVWSVESISHYKDNKAFFKKASEILRPGGTMAIMDWFKREDLSAKDYKKYIEPIEKGMLVKLHAMSDYVSILKTHGLELIASEDLNKNTAKTWDIALDVIKNKMFWKLALKNGREFVNFLRAFKAMKEGFKSGKFVYGLIVMRKM